MIKDKQGYEVKGVKSFRGMEWNGFNATLYRNGKKVAFCLDSGDGGEVNFDWVDWDKRKDWKTPESEAFDKFAKAQGKYNCQGYEGSHNAQTVIGELVGEYEERKRFKSMLNRKILMKKGKEIVSINKKFDPVQLPRLTEL